MKSLVVVLVSLAVLSSCASGPRPTSSLSEPERAALFAERLQTDPNAALCQTIVQRLDAGDFNAFGPYVDRPALVERALKTTTLPAAQAAGWRDNAASIDNLSRYSFPKGARFYCLGTVKFQGDDVIALRGRANDGELWFHVLLHLQDKPAKPIDDFFVVSSGIWHSQLQMFFDDPRYAAYESFHDNALNGSHLGKHEETLAAWQALPAEVRLQPVIFSHALNAVMTVTPPGAERGATRFKAIAGSIESVFAEPLTRAYWQLFFRARLDDVEGAMIAVDQLTTPLNDPLADELKEWVRRRP